VSVVAGWRLVKHVLYRQLSLISISSVDLWIINSLTIPTRSLDEYRQPCRLGREGAGDLDGVME
jgi:hypothetical protein